MQRGQDCYKWPGVWSPESGLELAFLKVMADKDNNPPSVADHVGQAAGGITGTVAGAALGTTAGPLGTLLGGIAGAISGWWSGRAIAEAAEDSTEADAARPGSTLQDP
jgi:phage tail tape-measure protein